VTVAAAEQHDPDDGRRQARRRFLRGAAAVALGGATAADRPAEAWAEPGTEPLVIRQPAEQTNTPVFTVMPATAGAAPFQVQMNSFANSAAAAGTYNRGMWFGWNAGRFAAGPRAAGRAGIYMGFEDNFYDVDGDRTYGAEWYTGYTTPDGTSVGPADLRPLYWRVKDSNTNTEPKSVFVVVDIGAGGTGSFTVQGGLRSGEQLLAVTRDEIYARLRTRFTAPWGSVQIIPAVGYAELELVAPGTGPGGRYGVVAWRDGSTPVWSIAATSGIWSVRDATNNDRDHISLTPGASDTTASTTLRSNLLVRGRFGMNGAAPSGRAAAIRAPSAQVSRYARADAQSIVDAVNSIRTVLRDFGFTD
jgi:hypothetical protein